MDQATSRRRPSSAASRPARSRCVRPTAPRRGQRAGGAPPAARPPARRASRPSTPAAPARPGRPRGGASRPRGSRRRSPTGRHRFRPAADRGGQPRQPGRVGEAGRLGQVVAGEPEPPAPGEFAGVVGEHHHAAGHAPHLTQPGDRVLPVGDGAEGHRGVEGLVLERQVFRGGGHARRRALRAQRPHDRRRLHRSDVAVGRFIGAAAGPDVQHRPRVTERSPDLRGDPRIGAPRRRVRAPDGVVQPSAERSPRFRWRH